MTLPKRTRISNNYQPSRLFSQYNEEAILLIIREICRATKLTYSSSSLQTSLSNHLGPGTVWPAQVVPFEPVNLIPTRYTSTLFSSSLQTSLSNHLGPGTLWPTPAPRSSQTCLSNHLGPGTVWPTQVAPFEPVITPVAPFKSVYQTTWDQVEFCLLKYLCPLKPVIKPTGTRYGLT